MDTSGCPSGTAASQCGTEGPPPATPQAAPGEETLQCNGGGAMFANSKPQRAYQNRETTVEAMPHAVGQTKLGQAKPALLINLEDGGSIRPLSRVSLTACPPSSK